MSWEEIRQNWRESFANLDWRKPYAWPKQPQMLLLIVVCSAAVVAGWFMLLEEQFIALEAAQLQEISLQQTFDNRLKSAAHLRSLKQRKGKIQQELEQLERQLPRQSEMDQLLSSINQAGLNRRLQFELFRPAPLIVKDHYAELPIHIRLSGTYADIGMFAADIAHLPRVVALGTIQLIQKNEKPERTDNALVFEATAKTFRTLDAAELAEKNKAKEGKK